MHQGRKKKTVHFLIVVFILLTSSPIIAPVKGQVNEFTIQERSEPIQQPISVNDSIFGATGLSWMKEFNHDLGMSWRRRDFTWEGIQLNESFWNWSYFDSNVQGCNDRGLYTIVLLVYGNPAVTGDDYNYVSQESMPLWEEYVRQVVRRYKGNASTIAYEIWNEPNLNGFWKGTAEEYARLLITASKAIREEDPDALILVGGTASSPNAELGGNAAFYENLFKWNQSHAEFAGQIDFDVYNIHGYFNTPSEYAACIKRQKNLCNEYGFDWQPKPSSSREQDKFSRIWCTEYGWNDMQHGIKSATIACFENLGRHLIFGMQEFKDHPNSDALGIIIPVLKNCTPFQSASTIEDFPFNANIFNIYVARTHDGKIAVAYWDEQQQGTVFDLIVNSKTTSIKRIILPNMSWEYTDFSLEDGASASITTVKNLVVEHDFKMLIIDTESSISAVKIVVHLTPEIFWVFYIVPGALVVSIVITVYNLARRIKRSREKKENS
ncbi:MAG: cellulase family glycosylhydrolase [Candidatus Hodarchaeota archaeon]